MKTFEELKKAWDNNQSAYSVPNNYDQATLEGIFKSRANKQVNKAMQYFWPALVWQITVYALLSHVMVKYWADIEMVRLGIGGVLLFIPFTVMLLKKFKTMANTRPGDSATSLHRYVVQQEALLYGFYRFKIRYEFMQIPLSAAIGTFLIFKLYVPGGVYESPVGAGVTLFITLVLFVIAIRRENKTNFEQPLYHLREIMDDFKDQQQD